MQELVNQSKAAPQSPSVPKQPGPPVMTSDPNMLSNEEATAHVSRRGTVDAYFLTQQCTRSALFMKICCSLVVWADTRPGPEVSGWAVSHRSVQLADSGRPDWQAARGSVSVCVYCQFLLEDCIFMQILFFAYCICRLIVFFFPILKKNT